MKDYFMEDSSGKQLAYLASGKLFFVSEDGKEKEHQSQFGQEMKDRALKVAQKNSWKNRPAETDFLSSRQLWGVDNGNNQASMKVHFTALARYTNDSELIYALTTPVVGGLFHYDRQKNKERRLFHKEGMTISDLARHKKKDQFVCSLRNADGTAFIAKVGETLCDQITEGDCVDEAPSWVDGQENTIVYQSQGVGRNKDGFAVGLGPSSIQKLNLSTGDQEELLYAEDYDFLLPRMTEDGDLFYIKRPYESMIKSVPLTTMLKDTILFPFRLGRAFLGFLNFFSLTFTRKPLTSQDGQKAESMELDKVFLRGRMIDARDTMNDTKIKKDEAPLVPGDWLLIKRSPQGVETEVAKSVLAYDFDREGNIVFTNGRATFRCSSGKSPEVIFKNKLTETIICLD